MRRSFVSAVVLALVLLAPTSAWAYSDWGWDPNESNADDGADTLDLATQRRDVTATGSGRTFLRVTVGVHAEAMSKWFGAKVKLDTRGDRQADYLMHMFDADMNGNGCSVGPVGSTSSRKGAFAIGGDRVRCRVPVSWVHADKRVRWKVSIHSLNDPSKIVDEAPDTGWYA